MNRSDLPNYFPNLPDSLQKLQEFFESGEFDTQKLITLLEKDPLLCANILKLANSAAYGGKNKIVSIEQAIARLGFVIIRGIIMATFIQKSFPIHLDIYGIDLNTFDKINQTRVQLLRRCFYDLKLDMQMLQSVAFLLENSKIVSAYLINKIGESDHFKTVFKEKSEKRAEEEILGVDAYKIGAMLFKKWGFKEDFIELMQNLYTPQNREGQILLIISKAANITGILESKNKEQIAQLCKKYKFDWTSISKCIEEITI